MFRYLLNILDAFAKSHQNVMPEHQDVMPEHQDVMPDLIRHPELVKSLDSDSRRNDGFMRFPTFYEDIILFFNPVYPVNPVRILRSVIYKHDKNGFL